MPDVMRRPMNFPFRRPAAPEEPLTQFQVILSLDIDDPCSTEDLEEAVTMAVEALVTDARGVALGPVGGANFETKTVELEFTVKAVSPAVLHAKVGEVLRVLERHGFEYVGSSDTRLGQEEALQLVH